MDPINIAGLDFLMRANSSSHHTDKFVGVKQNRDIVLRRGQDFIIQFTTSGRDFDPDIDAVRLIFSFGKLE